MLAEDEYVEIDSFVPDPGQSKTTTFSKAQRKKVARGHDTVTKQDNAMCVSAPQSTHYYQAITPKFQAFTEECVGTDVASSESPEGIH